MSNKTEVQKLQQHLALLTDQYNQLQSKYNDVNTKYTKLTANSLETSDSLHSFPAKLIENIKKLHKSHVYTDLQLKLSDNRLLTVHKLVLSSHSDVWNESNIADKSELDWTGLEPTIGEYIVEFLYTGEISMENNNDDDLTLKIVRQAYSFKLTSLVNKCEVMLIGSVNVRNCVRYYSVAEEINALQLRDYCSNLISTHWDDLNGADFDHMSGPLLHRMLKEKTQLPLHSAVRLQREEVIFLCLVENSSKLSDIVNVWSPTGELPLELALRAHNASVASTLLQHNADINIRDGSGETLLHRALKREDWFSAQFLLENNCDATLTTRCENESALHLVAGIENSVKIAERLINKNANINGQNRQGFTPLHIAIMADNRAIFDLLLKQPHLELNIKNGEEHCALYYALVKYERLATLSSLDTAATATDDDVTPVDVSDDNYARHLIDSGAHTNVIYTSSSSCDSLLQVLLGQGFQWAARYLVKMAATATDSWNFNHSNTNGESILHTACHCHCSLFLRFLLLSSSSSSAQPPPDNNNHINPNLVTTSLRHTALHYAVLANDSDCIQVMVEYNDRCERSDDGGGESGGPGGQRQPVNFNLRDVNGETPLSLAVTEGNIDLVPILIKGKADVNVRNSKDSTLLHQAILNEDSKTAIFLLDHGADINAKTAEYETPLQLAIHCHLGGDVVHALCTRGVDMAAKDSKGNCALWAALTRSTAGGMRDGEDEDDVASVLVRHGADTDCWGEGPDGCQQTLLHRAIDENNETAAIFLIQAGCSLDTPRQPPANSAPDPLDGATPLHLCATWGLEAVAQTLVEHGANCDARDAAGKTALHVAIEHHQAGVIGLLLSVPGVDLAVRDRAGMTVFAAALAARDDKAARGVLGRMPSAAEQFDGRGHNFLHVAIKKGDVENVLFLLSVNVDVNSRVQDASLTPPLHLAARAGNETLLRSLILAGARCKDRDANKKTALHIAAEAGNAAIVTALLQNNIDYDATDVNADNALHIAVREGHLAVVRVLLTESSINAEAANLKGRNPLHELCRCGKDNAAAICELFFECMPDYPINRPDLEGNSPLLLAYTKGNGNLCRALVRLNACLASENAERITIFNYQVASKQLLHRLLDQLTTQGSWPQNSNHHHHHSDITNNSNSDGGGGGGGGGGSVDMCQECGRSFTLTIRRHHCRHCGRVLCGRCSECRLPIVKFNESKPVRVCQVCFEVLKTGGVGGGC